METLFEKLDGKRCKVDDVMGTLKHEIHSQRYPYPATYHKLIHYPSKTGQKTEAYRQLRRQLGDDWITDLTYSEDLGSLAERLGVSF